MATWCRSSTAAFTAVLSLFDSGVSYKLLQNTSKNFHLVDGNLSLPEVLKEYNHMLDPELDYIIKEAINPKVLSAFSELSDAEKSYFIHAYILDHPIEFRDLCNISILDHPFYELDTGLKSKINANDYLEDITP